MKIRTGFISNSSSSSFVIEINKLTETQLYCIRNHYKVFNIIINKKYHKRNLQNIFRQDFKTYENIMKNNKIFNYTPGYFPGIRDKWKIVEDGIQINGSSDMTNFNMREFLEIIGVLKENIIWEY